MHYSHRKLESKLGNLWSMMVASQLWFLKVCLLNIIMLYFLVTFWCYLLGIECSTTYRPLGAGIEIQLYVYGWTYIKGYWHNTHAQRSSTRLGLLEIYLLIGCYKVKLRMVSKYIFHRYISMVSHTQIFIYIYIYR